MTGIETYEKIKKHVYVMGQDVDILVLLTALTPDYIDILMLKEADMTPDSSHQDNAINIRYITAENEGPVPRDF
ncbi:hypothetical protein AVEN_18937-1 [Araneus ventricosus]|uniref:Uncharacterized protein n=1 Tax=Araneus ventricosus TaxID=182803 RepID=A0A4Y2QP90_ARAVE|nr:hypothetical protein AVEN_18937-1 [Araneus ventricosus]